MKDDVSATLSGRIMQWFENFKDKGLYIYIFHHLGGYPAVNRFRKYN
jgi:hypothetical protein